jgi:hypothetical protein
LMGNLNANRNRLVHRRFCDWKVTSTRKFTSFVKSGLLFGGTMKRNYWCSSIFDLYIHRHPPQKNLRMYAVGSSIPTKISTPRTGNPCHNETSLRKFERRASGRLSCSHERNVGPAFPSLSSRTSRWGKGKLIPAA